MASANYMISYDLIKRKDYPELIKAIKALSSVSAWHCLASTWIVKVDRSSKNVSAEIRDELRARTSMTMTS